ncbi:MAG: phosphoenolpyruvate carboxykinase (ATP) [Candidatus Heimdallarchaeota archaeon]|nr:phosphoenolpyruvate carboxykinase (ATP) [Candidatus Heimdallarchaeota archaeon]MCK4290200.1 phosphoenolpyruvate carboxykinase (ATP) [Candidatus Heimdallarchaeota archaeon]
MTKLKENLDTVLSNHKKKISNPERKKLIQEALDNREAIKSANGALATWTPPESTGRSPKDTVIVRRPLSEKNIDWTSPNCLSITEEIFDMAWEDALKFLSEKEKLYISDRSLGADSSYTLKVRTISDKALHVLFTYNMFRPNPKGAEKKSFFAGDSFTIVVLPYDKLNRKRYEGKLRKLPNGETSNMIVAMDFDRGLGVIIGSAYCGSIKKLMFTVMNYMLPEIGILPIHCSANEGPKGDTALLLGLSGTGKTTLSADPSRSLLGDDEHGWSENGVANFEYGCYAKLINLRQDKEPEIYDAMLHDDDYLSHGAIFENTMMYPNGVFDLFDDRLTPNSRGSYPLSFLSNIKTPPIGKHPKTILFLTADANGILPPVSKLTSEQAMLWFLMGYTSKLAGTETGIVDPVSTFSRFFGEPFMPRNPNEYAKLLGTKMKKHGTEVYLVNTGWSGGPYGIGERMDINLTRRLVDAALKGELKNVEYQEDEIFHLHVPKACKGVPPEVLWPKNTWEDKEAFDIRAKKLAQDFSDHFDTAYSGKVDPGIAMVCPGK